MLKKVITVLLVLIAAIPGISAQEVEAWSLEKCIFYAHENNLTVKREVLNSEYRKNLETQKKYSLYPSLNASSDYTVGYGRVPDESNYTFHNGTTQSGNLMVGTSIPLYAGLSNRNEVKKNENDFLAAMQNVEKVKNDITLMITSQFLQILFDKELLKVAKEQYETSRLQLERTEKLVEAGSVAMGSLLEIKSQAAKEALNVTQQENNLVISKLNLAQLLDLENPVGFDIELPIIPDLDQFMSEQPNNIYNTALGIMPQIKGSEYQLISSEYDLKIAKGSLQPSLSLNGGWNTRVSKFEGEENFSFSQKFKDNANSYVGVSLRIPIFNGLQSKTAIKNAKIGLLDAQYQLQTEKLNLRKEIQQAYADAMGSYKKYLASDEAVNSFKESFRYTEKKFNVGLVNSVDYNVSKTDFTRAQSDLLQSKYEYILRTKILDFYNGIPIKL